jgi:hypothetical protein
VQFNSSKPNHLDHSDHWPKEITRREFISASQHPHNNPAKNLKKALVSHGKHPAGRLLLCSLTTVPMVKTTAIMASSPQYHPQPYLYSPSPTENPATLPSHPMMA